MFEYSGSAIANSGSKTIIGINTKFLSEKVRNNYYISFDTNKWYEIDTVKSETSLILFRDYSGTSGTFNFKIQGELTNNDFWITKYANYTAKSGENIYCDTTSESWNLILPLNAISGDKVSILDPTNKWKDNNLTVVGQINGESNYVCKESASLIFTFVDASYGWNVLTSGKSTIEAQLLAEIAHLQDLLNSTNNTVSTTQNNVSTLQNQNTAFTSAITDIQNALALISSENAQNINDVNSSIAAVNAAVLTAQNDINAAIAEILQHGNTIVSLQSRIGNAESSITTVQANFASETEALSGQITTYQATLNDFNASLIQETLARSTQDSALAADITLLNASVGNNSASLTQEILTRANTDSALSAMLTNLSSTVGNNYATFNSLIATLSTNTAAIAYQTSSLSAVVDTNIASITQEALTRANADSALSALITSLTSTVDNNTAAIISESITRANAVSALATSTQNLIAQTSANLSGTISKQIVFVRLNEPVFDDIFPFKTQTLPNASLETISNIVQENNTALNLTVTLDNSSYVIEGEHTVYMNLDGSWSSSNEEYFSSIFKTYWINPNETYEFSAYVATVNCRGLLIIEWRDETNTVISTTSSTIFNTGSFSGGTSLDNYQKLSMTGQAPSNSKIAYLYIRGDNTDFGSGSNPILVFTKPYFGRCATLTTTYTDWQPFSTPIWINTGDNNKTYVWNGYDGNGWLYSADTRIDTNISAISNEQAVRTSADSALAISIDNLTSIFNTNNSTLTASITSEALTRANADSALSTTISNLTSTVNTNNSTLTASISSEATTRATADSALSITINDLTSTVDNNTASINSESSTRASADTVLTNSVNSLTSTVNTNNTTLTASISSEATTRANQDGALSTRIDTQQSNYDASLSQLAFETYTRSSKTDSLAQSISTLQASFASNQAAIATETTTRANAVSALSTRIDSITAIAGGSTAAVDAEASARASADSALSTRIDDLTATVDTNTSSISTEQTTRANGDSANATSITNLTSTVNNNYNTLSSNITNLSSTVSTNNSTLTNSINSLTSTVNNNTASINSESSTRASADTVLTNSINSLTSTVNSHTASINNEISTRASADTALTNSINSLTSTVNSNTSAINNEASTRATADTVEALARTTLSSSLSSSLNPPKVFVRSSTPSFNSIFGVNQQSNPCGNTNSTNGISYWTNTSRAIATFAVDSGSWAPTGGSSVYLHLSGTWSSTATYEVFDLNTWGQCYWIDAGATYEWSFYSGAHRCNLFGYISWYNSSNTWLGNTLTNGGGELPTSTFIGSGLNTAEKAGGTNISSFKRLGLIAVAPAGAAKCYFTIRGDNSGGVAGQADPYMFITRMYFGRAQSGQTTFTDWQPFSAPLWFNTSDNNKLYTWNGINGTAWQLSSDSRIDTNIAAISSESTTRANADSALSSSITSLTSTVNSHTASISSESTTRANADSALSSSITTLNSTVGGHTSSISQLFTTTNGLSAQWALTGSIDGTTGGLVLTGTKRADGTGAQFDLKISANVEIDGNAVINGTVSTNQMTTGAAVVLNNALGTRDTGTIIMSVPITAKVKITIFKEGYSSGTVYSAANMNLYLSINGQVAKTLLCGTSVADPNNYYMYSYTEYPGSFEYIYIPNAQPDVIASSSYSNQSSYFTDNYNNTFKANNTLDSSNNTSWFANGTTGWISARASSSTIARSYRILGWSSQTVWYQGVWGAWIVFNPSTADEAPKNWTFEGSTNNSTWVVLHTVTNQTGWGDSEERTFTFTNSTAYTYFRLNISANNGNTSLLSVVRWGVYAVAQTSGSNNISFRAYVDSGYPGAPTVTMSLLQVVK